MKITFRLVDKLNRASTQDLLSIRLICIRILPSGFCKKKKKFSQRRFKRLRYSLLPRSRSIKKRFFYTGTDANIQLFMYIIRAS